MSTTTVRGLTSDAEGAAASPKVGLKWVKQKTIKRIKKVNFGNMNGYSVLKTGITKYKKKRLFAIFF
jgi:hypothetical protein